MNSYIELILLLCLFGGWILSEFGSNRFIRITLGLLNISVCIGGVFICMNSYGRQMSTHHMILGRIERKIDKGELIKLKEALTAYEECYSKSRMACHQKSPQYVKVVSGRKRVKHTRG